MKNIITISKIKRTKISKAANRQAHLEARIVPPKSSIYVNKKVYSRTRLPKL